MLNPNNFIADSDYPFDMVAKAVTGSIAMPDRASIYVPESVIFPHGLNFRPLVAGFWSLNPDFQPAYPFGVKNDENVGIDFCGANSENIMLATTTMQGATYYYKVYCLVPSSLEAKVLTPSLLGFKNFVFNSDLAYMKIYAEGEIEADYENPPSVGHNLGFVPFMRFWEEYQSDPQKTDYLVLGSGNFASPIISENELSFSTNWMMTHHIKVYYRIYADET